MMDTGSMAAALYGDAAPPEADPAIEQAAPVVADPDQVASKVEPPAENTNEAEGETAAEELPAINTIADVLPEHVEAGIPDDIRALRDADETRRLYSPSVEYAGVIDPNVLASTGLPPEAVQALQAEFENTLADLSLSKAEATDLVEALDRAADTAPADRDPIAWREQAVELLNVHFGNGAAAAAQAARQVVARDPRLANLLITTGAGDHPQVILAIAKGAMRQRSKLNP